MQKALETGGTQNFSKTFIPNCEETDILTDHTLTYINVHGTIPTNASTKEKHTLTYL
jgi:hypothetical protein